MSGRDWERTKVIFEQAKNAPLDELDRLLHSLCDGDRSMAVFVASLVRNDRDASTEAAPEGDRVFCDGSTVAGRLRIVRFIDRGAMGEVYEAFDERLRQRVALKTIRRELIRTGETLARFEREIRMAREVTHPNLCRVFDYVEDSTGIPCYTMELIEGESLHAFLARERPLPIETALPLIRQVASGVDALHQRRIIHRDLKPANIMLTHNRDGGTRVVLMDFGLAKLLNADDELFRTSIEQQMGAPYFLAPELLRNSSPSVASDLYAFGLVADEMVTRCRAFSAQSLQSLYFAKLWEAPIAPRERCENLPENWDRAILQCIATEQERRYQSAGEIVQALENEGSLVPEPMEQKPPGQLPAWRPKLTRALGPIAKRPVTIGGVSAALLGGAIMLLTPHSLPVSVGVQVYDMENATGDPAVSYLCNGTSNELIRRLTQLKNIRVLPMRSTREPHSRSTGEGISVEGMLRGSGDQLRLTVLLTDNKTGEAFDSGVYKLMVADSLGLENEVATNTVAKIQAHLAATASGLLRGSLVPLANLHLTSFGSRLSGTDNAPTSNGAAFDSYMRGRLLLDEYSRASVATAITYLRRAVDDDPNFALGHATLTEALLNQMTFLGADQQREALAEARGSATRALELDPSLAEAEAAMAYVLQAEWDWQGAATHFQRALEIKPEYAAAKRRYAGLLLQLGRTDEALKLAREAFGEDPYDRGAIPGIGLYLYLAGRYDEAIRFLDEQVGENDMQGARHNLGDALAEAAVNAPISERKSLFERALAQAARVTSIERKLPGGETPMGDEMYSHYYTLLGDKSRADFYFNRVRGEMEKGLASPAMVAWILALRGEKSQALDLLERALQSRDRSLFYVKLFPALSSLRDEGRFKAILAQMKL